MSDAGAPGYIDVELKFFPLAFLLFFFKPRLEIDGGAPMPMAWGTARVPVAPGQHRLRAYAPYLFLRFMGDASTVVDVAPGQAVRATWSAPWLVFLAGTWRTSAAGAAPGAQPFLGAATATTAASAAAAWHPDPTGRHQLRYWDGAAWTTHVSDNGVTATDPLG